MCSNILVSSEKMTRKSTVTLSSVGVYEKVNV